MGIAFSFLLLKGTNLRQQRQSDIQNVHYFAATVIVLAVIYFCTKRKHVYLVDFTCYRPPDHCRTPLSTLHECAICAKEFDQESISFQLKTIQRSGIGSESCMPSSVHSWPRDSSLASSREEAQTALCTIVKDLLDKHGIKPESIDILISNCSLFSPTPSIAAMIINWFGMKSDVMSFNLSGMGCSAGILSLALARDLLKVHKNSLALVLSMEALTPHAYPGKDKSMLLSNCLFRLGASAILLSNREYDKMKAKYDLQYLVRTHSGWKDKSYNCVYQKPDSEGHVGVSLSRDVISVAGEALKSNISRVGPLVLPFSEQFHYGLSMIRQKLVKSPNPLYVPDFKKAFEHFCIHAGGRAVIDSVVKNLRMENVHAEPSRMTLYRFGNTSSSSIWYELSYIEAMGRMKKGDRIWQIAFGSGFKCNTAVWKCISEIAKEESNAWSDGIHRYPVQIPTKFDY
ncbi:3-ketoacyl-CoA synthase 6 [Nymphaea thermarum]|nr:3-ketoacyl-CoA synthase 6 [Nymphaea thermarum]